MTSNVPNHSNGERWLFLGNPGTGKSTIINSLIGQPKAQSGISYGTGKTQLLQRIEHDGVIYMDTPGLADVELKAKAAEAITQALREDAVYKIFFVVALINGRVNPQDIATITLVLDSVNVPDIKFTVIVNQVRPRQYSEITKHADTYELITAAITSGKYSTGSILFIPALDELDEAENALFSVSPDMTNRICDKTLSTAIARDQVRDIDIDDSRFQAEIQRMESELQSLVNDKQKQEATMVQLKKMQEEELANATLTRQQLKEGAEEQESNADRHGCGENLQKLSAGSKAFDRFSNGEQEMVQTKASWRHPYWV